jgi:sulfotransferase
MERIFFNSSLPRSGSSLFQNLVSDNPDFYCTPTSGFLELIYGAKGNFQSSPEFKAQDQGLMDNAFLHFCRGGMEWYFNSLTQKKYVLDKNRGWTISYDLANKFYPNPKMVCIVRDLRSIFSSMEKNFRKNPHRENHVQNPSELIGTTLRKRVDIWAGGLPVGIALDRLRDVIDQGIDKKILFIRYEDLMANPESQMKRFYDYLEIPYYNHSFDKVTQHTHENDAIHGIYGDHKLRTEFKMLPNDFNEILGFELSEDIKRSYEWFFRYFNYL